MRLASAAAVAALLALPLAAWAADPKKKPAPGADKRVYTNDDLKDAGKAGGAVTFLAEPAGGTESTTASSESGESRPAAREDGSMGEDGWRARGREHRESVAVARAEVEKLEAKLQAMSNPLRQPQPIEALQPDPNHLLTTSEERQALEKELEAARGALADAERALQDFLEDARRQSVPPGWVEDR
jgi:hypothetical protein